MILLILLVPALAGALAAIYSEIDPLHRLAAAARAIVEEGGADGVPGCDCFSCTGAVGPPPRRRQDWRPRAAMLRRRP